MGRERGDRMIRFVIDLKVNAQYGLNKIYAGVHWSKRKAQAEEIHELVYYSMMQQNVPPVLFQKPVIIQFSFKSNLDLDNHGYLIKMLIDGMKDYILKDDSKKYVREIRQKFWGEDGILVEIWEVV
jgi:Holliday junction resolvase RusA-like endonuclease